MGIFSEIQEEIGKALSPVFGIERPSFDQSHVHYVLVDRKIVPSTLMEWCAFFASEDRIIGSILINGIHVSTVFMGINFDRQCYLFETMVWGGKYKEEITRHKSLVEAESFHEWACDRLRRGEDLYE